MPVLRVLLKPRLIRRGELIRVLESRHCRQVRQLDPDRQRKLVERMRNEIPNLTFRTAFIVGHPGETDADFDELCAFVKWAEFDRVGVFKYSHEEGTRAEKLSVVSPVQCPS